MTKMLGGICESGLPPITLFTDDDASHPGRIDLLLNTVKRAVKALNLGAGDYSVTPDGFKLPLGCWFRVGTKTSKDCST